MAPMTNSQPLLSVAMITYNHAPYIAQAIDSVLRQETRFPIEIVLGEDCSTDGTREIVREYQRNHPRVLRALLPESNLGATQNFVATLAECRGRYVATLEGDDYWTATDKLQKQVDFLEAHPECSLSCHRVQYIYADGSRPPHGYREDVAAGFYTPDHLIRDFFVKTCSVVMRGEWTRNLPEWMQLSFIGDWPLFCLAALHGKVALLDDNMAGYRVHAGGFWSSRQWEQRFSERVKVANHLMRELPAQYTDALRDVIFSGYWSRSLQCLRDADVAEARRLARKCVTSTPPWHQARSKTALALEVFLPRMHRLLKQVAR